MFLGFGDSLAKQVVTIPIKKALLTASKRHSDVFMFEGFGLCGRSYEASCHKTYKEGSPRH